MPGCGAAETAAVRPESGWSIFGAGAERPGAHERIHPAEQVPDFGLDQAAHAHGLQIVFGGCIQAGFEAGNLSLDRPVGPPGRW